VQRKILGDVAKRIRWQLLEHTIHGLADDILDPVLSEVAPHLVWHQDVIRNRHCKLRLMKEC